MPRHPKKILALLLLIAFQAHAQQYRWTDEKGRVQYTDTPPPASAKGVQKKNLNAAKTDGVEPYALQVARKAGPVKLYTSPDCPGCQEARKLLNDRGIPFGEISITNAKQMEELKSVSGGTGVPVMLVGSAVQKGFEERAYNAALDSAGYPKIGALKPRSQPAPEVPKPPADQASPPAAPTEASKAR